MTPHYAIIGAGAGGLCAAKHLVAKGIEVTIFEIGSRVGGLWVYDDDSGLSPAYKSLHINSEARVSCFEEFHFPPGAALYPDHAEMSRYFEAYAAHFDLTRRIRFGGRVTPVAPENGGFQVTLASGETARFDGVIVATGHQSVPRHPPGFEAFAGQYLHAHAYRVPTPFADKRVLVIGPGNSGVDIASHLCAATAQTVLSARPPVLIIPRMMFGVPNSRVFGLLERPWLPWSARVWLRTQLTRIFHGTIEQWASSRHARARTRSATRP